MTPEVTKSIFSRIIFETQLLDTVSESMQVDIKHQLEQDMNCNIDEAYTKELSGDIEYYSRTLKSIASRLDDLAKRFDS